MITGIKVEESGDGTETTYQYGPDGYVLKISDNDLIQNGNGATVSEFVGKDDYEEVYTHDFNEDDFVDEDAVNEDVETEDDVDLGEGDDLLKDEVEDL